MTETRVAYQPKVGIVLVNLNAYEHSKRCLESLAVITYTNAIIIVVDNGSRDGSGLELQRQFSSATFLFNDTNAGATGGKNLGIEYALEQGCKHVLVMDNDALAAPGFLEPLVARLEGDASVGVVSSKIYYYTEARHNKPDILWYAGSEQKWHLAYNHIGDTEIDRGQYDTAHEVPIACGCSMLLRGEVLRKIGGFADEYFVYWEEAAWSMEAKKWGYSTWYEPASVVYHNLRNELPGQESAFYLYMHHRNFLIFGKRYFHGLKRIQFVLTFPLHVINRFLICIRAKNLRSGRAIFQGVLDYCKGYRGKRGLKERGLLR